MRQYPVLHAPIAFATDALVAERQAHAHYERARIFERRGTAMLAAHWLNVSIQVVIATVQMWMDVAAMLAGVERDAPDLAPLVRPLLERVGSQQQRVLTLLAILQGIHFTYCQTRHVRPTLLALPEEDDDNEHAQDTSPTLLVLPSPADQAEVQEVQP